MRRTGVRARERGSMAAKSRRRFFIAALSWRGALLGGCALTLTLSLSQPQMSWAQQESPAQWLARIFDPGELGVAQFPDATLNRKLSVDAIQLERGGSKRIGVYLIAPDQLDKAAEFFAKQFGMPAQVTGENTQFVTYAFDFTSGDKGPAKLKGLKVTITRSPFVDNKGQITMEYQPPAK